MSEKQVAGTAFGDVEYETVDCSSCGQTELKDEAKRFVIGGFEEEFCNRLKFKKSKVNDGWACRNCADDSPVGFPVSVSFWERLRWLITGKI